MPRAAAFESNPDFRLLAARQDRVLSRRQLREVGVTGHHLATRIANGTWQDLGPYVVVLHSGPLSRPQQLWAAVLHGGPGAVLSRETAAEAAGLAGFTTPALHVTAPHGTSRDDMRHPMLEVVVHESVRLGPVDVHPTRTPPQTRLPRSVVDAASAAPTDRRCRALIAAAVQQRLVLPGHLRAAALPRPTLPRRKLLLETIDDVEGGSQSLPEIDFLRGLRRVGLPAPVRQRIVRRRDGRYYLDAEFDPYRVTVEVNGAQHLELLAKEHDDLRRTRLAIGGRLVVDLGSYTVRHHNDLAMLLIAEALLSRGWMPDRRVRNRLEHLQRLAHAA